MFQMKNGMYLNYVKICLSAIELLKKVFGEKSILLK